MKCINTHVPKVFICHILEVPLTHINEIHDGPLDGETKKRREKRKRTANTTDEIFCYWSIIPPELSDLILGVPLT